MCIDVLCVYVSEPNAYRGHKKVFASVELKLVTVVSHQMGWTFLPWKSI